MQKSSLVYISSSCFPFWMVRILKLNRLDEAFLILGYLKKNFKTYVLDKRISFIRKGT